MIQGRRVIGAHALFFPSGVAFTVPSAGTAGRAAKPGAADTGWIDLGIADFDLAPDNKTQTFYAPAPGARVAYDRITSQRGLKIKATLMELSNISLQMVLAAAQLPTSPTAGGQYNQLSADPVLRGWLKLQQYDQSNTLINTLDSWVAMVVTGDVKFGDKEVDVSVEADVLWSTLNTGSLS